ncbi:hypothetical protein INR49_018155 [Caranx melampygus]|nr:hypothetical protein INR49_018155 [Caranx melampygus]
MGQGRDHIGFVNWSGAIGGAVNSLVVHQHRNAVGCEAQVQLHSGGPIPTGLEQEMTGSGDKDIKRIRHHRKMEMYWEFNVKVSISISISISMVLLSCIQWRPMRDGGTRQMEDKLC